MLQIMTMIVINYEDVVVSNVFAFFECEAVLIGIKLQYQCRVWIQIL